MLETVWGRRGPRKRRTRRRRLGLALEGLERRDLPAVTLPPGFTASMIADRFSLEIAFRDCKEIIGAGQQQVRFVWANVGVFHLCL